MKVGLDTKQWNTMQIQDCNYLCVHFCFLFFFRDVMSGYGSDAMNE